VEGANSMCLLQTAISRTLRLPKPHLFKPYPLLNLPGTLAKNAKGEWGMVEARFHMPTKVVSTYEFDSYLHSTGARCDSNCQCPKGLEQTCLECSDIQCETSV